MAHRWLLLCLVALGVAARESNGRQRFWCSRLRPDNTIQLSELRGAWLPLHSLMFDKGLLSLPSLETSWKEDVVGDVVLNVSERAFKVSSLGASKYQQLYKKVEFHQRENQKGRFDIINSEDPSERKELLVLAADSAKYMVWANCAPPPAELGAMPSGARVVISISVIVRSRDLLSPAQHEQIKARVRALLESREIPVALVLPPFTTGAAATSTSATLAVLLLALHRVL